MNVLLIDDDRPVLESLKCCILPGGHQCDAYDNPVSAMEAFSREDYDVVITDIKMPELSGIDVLKRIKTIRPATPVIILTGYADIDIAIDAVNFGAYAFFRKPFMVRDLIETLEKIETEKQAGYKKQVDLKKMAAEYSHLKGIFAALQETVGVLTSEQKEERTI